MLKVALSFVSRVGIRLVLILVATCALVCLAPGFDSDERQLDLRLDAQTIAKMREARSQDRHPLLSAIRYIRNLSKGDFGYSETFNRPVVELLSERISDTVQMVGIGLLLGWTLAAFLASSGILLNSRLFARATGSFATSLLCAPSILLGFGFVALQAPLAAAMACVVFPRVYLNLNTFFQETALQPHVITAEAAGMSRIGLFQWHILSINVPNIATLAASSISTALGALVPIEVIGDLGGLGQLAWKAALGRDLPLLLSVTLLIALANIIVSVATDVVVKNFRESTT